MVYYKKSIEFRLHYGASVEMIALSRELRKNMTEAEKLLWSHLRRKGAFDCKFRRQHALKNYIADFFCLEKELVIEIDGQIHDQESVKAKDLNRTAELERLGLTVIRFKNEEVMNDLSGVLEKIKLALAATSSPSP